MKRALIPFVASVLISAVLPDDATAAFSGYYRLLARHSGKALNVTGNGTADGADIVQWPAPSAQPNDQWEISDVGSGYYRITARHSGKVVNVEGNSTAEGANVVQWTYNSANLNSQWQVADAGSGYYRVTARHSGKVLNVAGAGTANGANVDQATWTGANHQMWQLVPVASSGGLEGPGLSKVTFSSAEVFKPIGTIPPATIGGVSRGIGLATMHKGWLATVPAADSGKSGGGFAFYDVSNPRAPVLVSSRSVPSLREQHGFARSAPGAYAGDYVVLQAGTGIEFWDWTDVRNPALLKAMVLPGVAFSDYDVGAWWLAWQAPFVYVAGSGNGIYVVDATDPRNPTLVKQIPTSAIGGFRIHPLFVVGNLLVATSADFSGSSTGVLTMDISDPRNPTVIKTQKTGFPVFYSAFFNGNKLIGLGFRDHQVHVWDLTNPAEFPKVAAIGGMDRPAYATVQDGHALVGDEKNFVKINLSGALSIVGRGTSGVSNRSEDIATPLGNVALMSNDHPTNSAIIAHKATPDNTGPSVTMVNPANNATGQRTSSRVGITLSDWIDLRSVNNTTFIVRPVGGSALSGKYSGEQGILNFWPSQPFVAGTTYEVVIPAGGLKDFSGNTAPSAFTSRFTIAGTNPTNPPTVQARVNGAAVVGANVAFAITSSSGGSLTYSWDFGDGTAPTAFSSASTASHAYAGPGHYAAAVTARNTAGQSSSSFTQAIHNPLTASKPAASGSLTLDAALNRMWVANPDSDTVTAIDITGHAKVFEKPVGLNPRTLGRAPDGTIWVVNQGSATISVLAGDTGNLVTTIALPYGSQPYGIAFAPDGTAAYVTTQGSRQLLKLSPTTRAIVSTLGLGFPLRGVAVTHDSARIFATRFVSPVSRGEVVEVSAATFTLTRTIGLAFDPGPDGNTTGRGVPNYLSAIALSPDGRQARVPSKKDNTARGQFRDGQPLDFETTVRTILSYIDLGTNGEILSMRVDFNDRDMAQAVAYSPLGDYVFVATQGTNTVEILSAYDNRLATGIPDTGLAPQGLALSADGRKLFVQNFMSRTVSIYDVSGIVNSTTNQFTKLAEVDTVTTEKLPAAVLKGKQIFYNAADPRMSLNNYISCASCHLDGGSDERVWDFTDRGEGLRNTVMLRGRAGRLHGNVHWSANFDEIQDFENDIRNAFGGTGFMTDAAFNAGTRRQPLGDPKNGLSADLDALAAYVTSLGDAGRSPFRGEGGAMTADGAAGRALFNQLRCTACHAGREFTDSQSGFRHDVGTIKASSGQRLGGPLNGIDTPTLLGVWETPPYLHDGSSANLLHVLTTANASGAHGAVGSLSTAEQQQLVSYLQQIDEAESASAPSELFVARLDGRQQVPPVPSTASGDAKIVVLADGVTALVSLQMAGISSATGVHIHGPADPGASAGVVITLPSGTVRDFQVTLSAAQLADLRAGKLYVDVHTSAQSAGEIRGQFRSAATAPPLPGPTPTPTPGGAFSGYYRILARHSGKAVVVEGASTVNGANVLQWPYTSSPAANDEWSFTDLGGGYYHIVNRHSGRVMNVSGASTANGGDVIQWPATTGTNDDWQPVDLGNGYYRIVNRLSGKVLNVAGASTADGANVDQWSWANVNQEMFQILSVP